MHIEYNDNYFAIFMSFNKLFSNEYKEKCRFIQEGLSFIWNPAPSLANPFFFEYSNNGVVEFDVYFDEKSLTQHSWVTCVIKASNY